MATRDTDSADDVASEGARAGPVVLSREIEHREHGIVVRFELENRESEATRVRLEQDLPPERLVEDAGFRQDAAPEEWAVEDGLLGGEARVPAGGERSLVFGLRYEPGADVLDSLRPTTLEPASDVTGRGEDERADPERGESTDGEDGRVTRAVREVLGTVGSDDGPDAATEAPADGSTADGDTLDAEDPLATATDGGRTERGTEGPIGTEVTAGSAEEDAPAPRNGPSDGPTDLEAAVEAVEDDIEDEDEESGAALDEDLLPLDEDDEDGTSDTLPTRDNESDTDGSDTDGSDTDGNDHSADVAAALERLPETGEDDDGPPGSLDDSSGTADVSTGTTGASAGASGVSSAGPGAGGDTTGPAEVRLARLESRLSKLEAYEDALAAFIEESGTAEEVQATAREATAAVEELREEVRTARAERAELRDEVAELRAELANVSDLRASLLDALQEPTAGAAGEGAAD